MLLNEKSNEDAPEDDFKKGRVIPPKVKPTEFEATAKPNSKPPTDPEAALAKHYQNMY